MNGQLAAALLALYVAVAAFAVVSLVLLRTRPGMISGLLAGTGLSLVVVIPWAAMANLTIGPSGPLDLTARDLPGSYARLAAGPAGNAGELATAVIAITVLCLLLGRRGKRRRAAPGKPPAAEHAAPAVTAVIAPGPPARVHSRSWRPGDGGP